MIINTEPTTTLFIVTVLSSVVASFGLVLLVVMCLCCYPKDDENGEYQPITADSEKTAKKSPWLLAKSPAILKQSITFQKPARNVSVENVQPRNTSSDSSVNESESLEPRRSSHEGRRKSIFETATGFLKSSQHMAKSDTDIQEVHINNEADYPDQQLGALLFSVEYDFRETSLIVKIMKANNLPAKDFSGTSDPYVKVILLPDKRHKLETKVKKKCLNPTWNEIFCFEGFPYDKLESKTLLMQVFDYDRFSRDDVIGDVVVPLNSIDVVAGTHYWRNIQPSSKSRGKLGELLVSLCYLPTTGMLSLVIMKGRDLKAKDIRGTSDPYVKIWVMHKDKKVEKKKTAIQKCTLAPVFNESFHFHIPLDRIRDTSLLIYVMDFDKLGRNEMIGRFLLGMHSAPLEKKHWSEMLHKTKTQVAQWHLLKD